MPKIVFPAFYKKLKQDICRNYHIGDRYPSIRETAEKFDVSIQTAQKGITALAKEGIVVSKRKSGIFVINTAPDGHSLKGKTLLVLSRIDNPLFFRPFLTGVLQRTENTGIRTKLVINEFKDITGLAFGQYLVEMEADGIITLNFGSSSALPFYHALREHVDLVSDIIIDGLPILPSVQTANYKHAFRAGRTMLAAGLDTFYVFGSYPEQNKRLRGFRDAVKSASRSIRYIRISEMDAMSIALGILNNLTAKTGLFLCDYTAVHYIASLCSRFRIQFRENSILAYDGEDMQVHYPGIPPIPCVAPSFKQLGYSLCDTMLVKWSTGKFPEPLQRKI